MSELNDFVGNLAACFSASLYLSGSQICYKIYKNNHIGDISCIPFLAAFFNTYIAFVYGVLVNNPKIIVVNIFGFSVETFYLIFYYHHSPNKKKLLQKVGFLLTCMFLIAYYTFIFEEMSKTAFYFIGYFGSVVAIVMFGSPLSSINIVLKNKSTESLSFPLSFANFATASLWSLYGVLINDYFVSLPNLIGSILGLAQLALFGKFPSQSSASARMRLKDEEMLL